ncbi:MAG: hypothetical protein M0P97_00190 [Candidatus Moranbacteria bacterium]|jgi:hypothetical protein|nr:hypothetical protein [Candidatus Moranbacteria bacterium]
MEIPDGFVAIERIALTLGGQSVVMVAYDGFGNRLLLEKLGHLKNEKCILFFDLCMKVIYMRRDDIMEIDTLEFLCAECPCAIGISDERIPQIRSHLNFINSRNALRSVIKIEPAGILAVETKEKEATRQAPPKTTAPKKRRRKNVFGSIPSNPIASMPIPDPDEVFVFTGGTAYRIFCGSEDITSSCKVDLSDPEKVKAKARSLRVSVVGIRVVEYSEKFPDGKNIPF